MRKVPEFKSDSAAERFLDQDLSDLDFSQFKPMPLEMRPKDTQLNIRLSQTLMKALKIRAKKAGIPYQKYIRLMLEQSLSRDAH